MKKYYLIGLACFALQFSAQADTPLFTPPQVALTVGTNWLSSVAERLELSGVYIATVAGGTAIDRGGFSTEYVIREFDYNTALRFKPGVCIIEPADLSHTYVGGGCVFGVVPDGQLETWLNQAPIFELIAKTVKWSNLYGFLALGSQIDKLNGFVAFGGGVKVW